jgi:hypothetical protein
MNDFNRLQQERKDIEEKLKVIGNEIGERIKQKKFLEKEHGKISNKINDILTTVSVTDHAVLRYIERVLGYDIEEIKKKILPEEIIPAIKQLTNCDYPLDGFKIIVRSNKVVTVYTNGMEETKDLD